MNTASKRQAGFSLVEVLIAVALMTVVIGTTTKIALDRQKNARLDSLVQTQVSEMRQLRDAALKQAGLRNRETTPGNSPILVSAPDLISAGGLPNSFADRGNPAGATGASRKMRSPFGQEYVVNLTHVLETSDIDDGYWSAVVTETGAPSAARLSRAGLDLTVRDVLSIKRRIANNLSTDHQLPVGVIAANSRLAIAPNSSWKLNLSASLASPIQNYPVLALLYGFRGVDLAVDQCELNPTTPACQAQANTGGPGYATCQFEPAPYSNATRGYLPASCPAGWDEVWRQDGANFNGTGSLQVVVAAGTRAMKTAGYVETNFNGFKVCRPPLGLPGGDLGLDFCEPVPDEVTKVSLSLDTNTVWTGRVSWNFWGACSNSPGELPQFRCDALNNPVKRSAVISSAGSNAICCDPASRR